MKNEIKLFEQKQIRSLYDEEKEKWYFSVVDIIAVLTESENPRKYWSVLKLRLKQEGSQLTTNCSQLKMKAADGKFYNFVVIARRFIAVAIQPFPILKRI